MDQIFAIASPIIAIIGAFLSIKFVAEGETGCVTTFGKASRKSNGNLKLIEPGFKFIIPVVQSIKKAHLKKNTDIFTGLQATLSNGLSYRFNAFIIYHIEHTPAAVAKILFEVEDYKELVSIIFENAIQEVLQESPEVDSAYFSKKIFGKIECVLSQNGIILESCGLVSFSATDASQSLIGIDYRIKQAIKYNGKLPAGVIAAAIGATPVVQADTFEAPTSNVAPKGKIEKWIDDNFPDTKQ